MTYLKFKRNMMKEVYLNVADNKSINNSVKS